MSNKIGLLRGIIHGIKNLLLWFKIIWADRHYDNLFIFRILKFKFILTAGFFYKHSISIDSIKIAKDIELCIFLLDRIIKNDYIKDGKRTKHKDIELLCEILKRELPNWWD
jgi:hypothetical protein